MLRALAFASLLGCAISPTESTSTDPAPLTGVDGSHDSADRACTVVLRGMTKDPFTWVFEGAVEVSTDAAGLVPQVMWTLDGSTWQAGATTAAAATSPTPGFARFSARVDAGAGPVDALQVVPFLALPGGGRLFDHNRNPGDLDNYLIASPDYAIWPAPAVCAPPSTASLATLTFAADFTQRQGGAIAAGGEIAIAYDNARLASCVEQQGGLARYDITAHVQWDSGELVATSVRDAPALVAVPTGAHHVAIWFEATNVDGCHAWDSAYGANYQFDVE